MSRKIVICGSGFLGSYIAKELAKTSLRNIVCLASRNPAPKHAQLLASQSFSSRKEALSEPLAIDVTQTYESRLPAFAGAHTIISLVGILYGSPQQFDKVQLKGAENVARAASEIGARLVHVSAIGADVSSALPYFRTKGLAERAVFEHVPHATVLRPSLVFGPGDGFFARFGTLSRFLPFLPVFGDGITKFQPVYAGDIARFIALYVNADLESSNTSDATLKSDSASGSSSSTLPVDAIQGKIFECGGPDVFTYREMMEIVLKYSDRRRPIISLPWSVGKLQGWALEKLPENILTLTRDQVEQLKMDNVAHPSALVGARHGGVKPSVISPGHSAEAGLDELPGFASILKRHTSSGPTSVHDVLPSYM
ncbi:NAD(P)-binding protein [Clavulina sp. PMI_390]|nr:NAD(P)-binding protein [Clavulina sp. PMI_390]